MEETLILQNKLKVSKGTKLSMAKIYSFPGYYLFVVLSSKFP